MSWIPLVAKWEPVLPCQKHPTGTPASCLIIGDDKMMMLRPTMAKVKANPVRLSMAAVLLALKMHLHAADTLCHSVRLCFKVKFGLLSDRHIHGCKNVYWYMPASVLVMRMAAEEAMQTPS